MYERVTISVAALLLACPFVLFGAQPQSAAPATSIEADAPRAPAAQAAPPSDANVRTTYVLGPGDQLLIHAVDVADISDKPQRLDPNGDIKLPMIGRVHAAGLTLEEFEHALTDRLKVYLQEPDVSVTVTEFRSQPVSVIGAVASSGIRQLDGRQTLVEVLSMAGGVVTDAGPTVRITRRLESGSIPLPEAKDDATGGFSIADVDLRALLDGRSPEKNIVIRPYDVISVPRAEVVYVIGEVGRPGALPLIGGNSISVIEAVSSSGGVLRTAAPSRGRILRRPASGQKRIGLDIDIAKVMQGKADDLALLAGDILIVPDSSGKRFNARAIEVAVQVGTFIATYGILH